MLTSEDLTFFKVLAASQSLAAAARTLDVTPSAVTQRLQQLERRFDLQLVKRARGRLQLTGEGELLTQRAQHILESLSALSNDLAARRGLVTGILRIHAPLGFGRAHIAPACARFRRTYPAVSLILTLSDRPRYDDASAPDLVVHIGELPNSSLIARKLAPNERILCASPSYLARRGYPRSPEDLRAHDCIALTENNEDVTLWRFTHRATGEASSVRVRPANASNDGDVVRCWGIAGMGVIVRSEWDVAESLRTGELVRLLPGWTLPHADVVVLLTSRHGRAAKVRKFLENLKQELNPAPWRSKT